MRIGFVGCGKLGLLVALTIESRGHEVKGYDINPDIAMYLATKSIPFTEEQSHELLRDTKMQMVSLQELCDWADILFLAPQTPHHPRYEGTERLPEERVDFDYQYLIQCVKEVDACIAGPKTCVIISTVLPGTLHREILPILSSNFRLVYEPLFIAMGTVYHDFLNPEFVLVGVDQPEPAQQLEEFYQTIHDKPIFKTDIRTAEGIKVSYNTYITMKTVLANVWGELAYKTGMNIDDIFRAWSLATDRLLSPRYLQAGMGDGGGCHPRDNIALSYVARRENLSFDIFEALMLAREKHADWLADLIEENRGDLPVVILGESFKPETNIKTGSPAILLSNILKERGIEHVIADSPKQYLMIRKALFFIGTKHAKYQYFHFPNGSVVIDPFRYINPMGMKIKLIQIGKPEPEMVTA